MLERVAGIIIKTQDYRETHKIVTVFSEKHGKFTAIAHGAKKTNSRMAAITQPFIYVDFLVYFSRGLSTIQQGEIIHSYRGIRESIEKTTYASYIAELTDKTIPSREPDAYIFNQFKRTLSWISEHQDAMIPIIMYELKVFQRGGFAPIVDHCVLCNRSNLIKVFSIVEGGLLCQNCQSKDLQAFPLSIALIKLLPILANVGLERVGTITVKRENITRLRQILDEYYDRYGGYYLKTRHVLRQLDMLL